MGAPFEPILKRQPAHPMQSYLHTTRGCCSVGKTTGKRTIVLVSVWADSNQTVNRGQQVIEMIALPPMGGSICVPLQPTVLAARCVCLVLPLGLRWPFGLAGSQFVSGCACVRAPAGHSMESQLSSTITLGGPKGKGGPCRADAKPWPE